MSLLELLLLLVVAGVCGSIGEALAGFSRGGCLLSVGVGFVGGLGSTLIVRSTGLPELLVMRIGGAEFPVVWSTLGSALFVALLTRAGSRDSVRQP